MLDGLLIAPNAPGRESDSRLSRSTDGNPPVITAHASAVGRHAGAAGSHASTTSSTALEPRRHTHAGERNASAPRDIASAARVHDDRVAFGEYHLPQTGSARRGRRIAVAMGRFRAGGRCG